MVTDVANVPADREAFLKLAKYALIKHSDMVEEMRVEALEFVIGAVEKYGNNYELASKSIKDQMDKKFGAPWHCVVGQNFAFEVTHEVKHFLYVYAAGTTSVTIWKG